MVRRRRGVLAAALLIVALVVILHLRGRVRLQVSADSSLSERWREVYRQAAQAGMVAHHDQELSDDVSEVSYDESEEEFEVDGVLVDQKDTESQYGRLEGVYGEYAEEEDEAEDEFDDEFEDEEEKQYYEEEEESEVEEGLVAVELEDYEATEDVYEDYEYETSAIVQQNAHAQYELAIRKPAPVPLNEHEADNLNVDSLIDQATPSPDTQPTVSLSSPPSARILAVPLPPHQHSVLRSVQHVNIDGTFEVERSRSTDTEVPAGQNPLHQHIETSTHIQGDLKPIENTYLSSSSKRHISLSDQNHQSITPSLAEHQPPQTKSQGTLTPAHLFSANTENQLTDNTLLQQNKHSLLQKQIDFNVQSYMSWPMPQFTRQDILQLQWVKDLKHYLSEIATSKQISIVTSNDEHTEVVINWLVSALLISKLPQENVLVLSVSPTLHQHLVTKHINSILIQPSDILTSIGVKRIRTAFNEIHFVRLSLFRLINHWGYDVVMYDSDAVLLKDPQPLFDAYHGVELVGSAGRGPNSIGKHWGRTICTGVLLMRSTQYLEKWWETMSKVAKLPVTDQGLVNIALDAMKVQWDTSKHPLMSVDMHGTCSPTPLRAVIVSETKICRYKCESNLRGQYYAWHKPAINRMRTVVNKRARAMEGEAWFLASDWIQRAKHSLTGLEWLRSLLSPSHSHV